MKILQKNCKFPQQIAGKWEFYQRTPKPPQIFSKDHKKVTNFVKGLGEKMWNSQRDGDLDSAN